MLYNLGKIKQIVDLNGDSVNFNLTFTIKSKSAIPFKMLVTTQENLDFDEVEQDFKVAEMGEISADISADNNEYNNYILILQSQEPNQVEVTIDKEDLPLREITQKSTGVWTYLAVLISLFLVLIGLWLHSQGVEYSTIPTVNTIVSKIQELPI